MNWNNITIHQLQEIHSCREMSDLERQMNILAIALNLSMDDVESMTLDKLTTEFAKLSFLNDLPKAPIQFMFKLRGRYFRLAKTPNEMCGHHFIELQQVFNGDVIESLHKIVALLSVEVDFFGRNKKVVDAQAHYEDEGLDTAVDQSPIVWLEIVDKIVKGDRTKWDFILMMPLIEFLNAMAFYKAKTKERQKRLEDAAGKGFNPYIVACLNEML